MKPDDFVAIVKCITDVDCIKASKSNTTTVSFQLSSHKDYERLIEYPITIKKKIVKFELEVGSGYGTQIKVMLSGLSKDTTKHDVIRVLSGCLDINLAITAIELKESSGVAVLTLSNIDAKSLLNLYPLRIKGQTIKSTLAGTSTSTSSGASSSSSTSTESNGTLSSGSSYYERKTSTASQFQRTELYSPFKETTNGSSSSTTTTSSAPAHAHTHTPATAVVNEPKIDTTSPRSQEKADEVSKLAYTTSPRGISADTSVAVPKADASVPVVQVPSEEASVEEKLKKLAEERQQIRLVHITRGRPKTPSCHVKSPLSDAPRTTQDDNIGTTSSSIASSSSTSTSIPDEATTASSHSTSSTNASHHQTTTPNAAALSGGLRVMLPGFNNVSLKPVSAQRNERPKSMFVTSSTSSSSSSSNGNQSNGHGSNLNIQKSNFNSNYVVAPKSSTFSTSPIVVLTPKDEPSTKTTTAPVSSTATPIKSNVVRVETFKSVAKVQPKSPDTYSSNYNNSNSGNNIPTTSLRTGGASTTTSTTSGSNGIPRVTSTSSVASSISHSNSSSKVSGTTNSSTSVVSNNKLLFENMSRVSAK
ncbi:hypothetical protein SAMD00019534_036540 [Acytostelium subglobosum LB1]|uniref:hypothetical protein n=1 Tax=Acytostelium subglobosum LB1 TaxID=1410327 RepID=UPI0006450AA9|nr:hypothetical protein SAMD00019534_036540 [Acytostelium subglobosum LB1]GAM20479.1 hypothetical protein SAMD00019534_036540 [Acytostelium subglobosum LB1]|eukprot:XP_012760000.1 hypothetical protein SAMD00019534_036540 [Acytostelium subglobosum LB1]